MKNQVLCLINIIFFLAEFATAQEQTIFEREGYTSLFSGKDLSGWKVPEGDNGHWSVITGFIDYDARSEAAGDKNLYTEKEYENFKLHVEWRFTGYGDQPYNVPIILENGEYLKDENGEVYRKPMPNADSGILLKGVGQANLWCWPAGSGELWSVRNNKDLPAEVRAGAVPSENADQPLGEWNAMDITVQDNRITVINNGIEVISHALYPGLDVKGPIGLQHHGGVDPKTGKLRPASSLVQFRNIWIKEL